MVAGADIHQRTYRTLAKVIETMNCGLVGRDCKGTIVFVNERLLAWLSYSREEVEGQCMTKLVPPELHDVVLGEIKATDQGDLRTRLTMLRRKDSTTFPVLIIPQRFFDSNGKLAGGFAVVVDLGAVQTAKPAGYRADGDVRATLDRIALELQTISLAANLPSVPAVALHHPELKTVSRREKEILSLLVVGDRVNSIAKLLHVSEHTVRNHLKSIYQKLDVHSQSGLIQLIRSLGT
jgi:PAS domain S-box-containing protein